MNAYAEQTGRWYDGLLYHWLADPALRGARARIRRRVPPGSSLIDMGCGTGELLFQLADRCSLLTGVEASQRMARYAARRFQRLRLAHVRVLDRDAGALDEVPDKTYDYATACMALHEMNPARRGAVLGQMTRVARRLIVVDYAHPPGAGAMQWAIRAAERLAGARHHRNFLDYQAAGGLDALLAAQGLTCEERALLFGGTLMLVVAPAQG